MNTYNNALNQEVTIIKRLINVIVFVEMALYICKRSVMMAMTLNMMDAINVTILVNQVVNALKVNVIESKLVVKMDYIIHLQVYLVNHYVEME